MSGAKDFTGQNVVMPSASRGFGGDKIATAEGWLCGRTGGIAQRAKMLGGHHESVPSLDGTFQGHQNTVPSRVSARELLECGVCTKGYVSP